MLMGMLMMSHMYAVAIGANIFTSSNLSYVADTIALQCHDWLKVRSRLELAKACSNEALCRAFRTDEWGTSSMWCACPKRITWPRTWNYDLSTIRQIRLAKPLPGLIHMWFKAPNLRLQNQKHLCQKKIWVSFRKTHKCHYIYFVIWHCLSRLSNGITATLNCVNIGQRLKITTVYPWRALK